MSEYDDLITSSIQTERAQAARFGFSAAADTNPDSYAEAQRVAKRTGVPVDTVFSQPQEMKRQARMGEIDFYTLAKTSPTTAALLADVDRAKLAHDDVENISGMESLLRSFKRGLTSGLRGNDATAIEESASILNAIDTIEAGGTLDMNNPYASLFAGVGSSPENLRRMRQGAQARLAENVAEYGSRSRKLEKLTPTGPLADFYESQGWRDATAKFFRSPFRIAGDIVAESTGLMAPAIPVIVASGVGGGAGALAATTGMTSANAEYGSAIAEEIQKSGIDLNDSAAVQAFVQSPEFAQVRKQAQTKAAVVGAFDAVTARAAGFRVRPSIAGNLAAQTAIQAAGGAGGEAFGSMASGQEVNAASVLAEAIGEMPGAVVDVSTMAAGRVAKGREKVAVADQGAELLDKFNELAKANKVLQRDPETFQSFITQVAQESPVQQVFIDANTLMQSGIAEQVATVSPAVAAQLPTTMATGGQIAIPVEEYAAKIAPTEYAGQLLDHLKVDPEGFSRAEAQQFMESNADELRAEVEQLLTEKEGDTAFKQSADAVRSNIKAQLDTAGRFTPQVNDAYASMVGNFFAVQSAKLGVTPEELFQRYPLKIGAEAVAGQQFAQGENLSLDNLLEQFDAVDTIDIQAPQMTEQEINDAQRVFLSAFPTNVTTYRRTSGIARRMRKASDAAANDIREDPAEPRVVDRPLGPFSGYRAEGVILAPDEFYNQGGVLKVKIYGKEQVEAGLIDEPALTFTVMQDGELSINGPTPGSATFNEFVARGWAEQSKAGEQVAQGWSNLINPDGGKMPMAQVVGLLADVHARVRAWKMEDYTGLHWSRATGALGGVDEAGSAMFFQGNATHRGAFSPDSLSISLLKNADLSTFLHESGHFFLEVQFDIAAQIEKEAEVFGPDTLDPGERELLADTQAMLNWFGIKDIATWSALDFEEKRSYHEQFARGFEAYLFEGRAPSIELQGLFQRFRAWLLAVYRDLKNLNVELTDEVRGVFDRMLASTEEIKLAEQGRSMMPLFTSPEQAGMTPEEFAAYQALGVDATNDAIQELQARGLRDMQWLHNARGRIIKQLQKESKSRRAEVQMDVRREVMSQPIYRAWEFLTGKDKEGPESVMIDDTGMKVSAHGKFDRASLADMNLAPEIIQHLEALRMVKNDSLHPDFVADMFGFTSGDELVRRLAATEAPRAEIEALTDVRMLEQYGDLSTPEAIERAADKAIHNDARTRFVATEANALAKASGQRKVLASAAKEFARAMIDRLKVRNVKPSQYAGAEVRASKVAEKASKAGDLATAAAEKRNQLVQAYATRAAYDAQEEIEKGLRYLKKFDSASVRKGLDADYTDQIDALLERFDLRKGQSLKDIDKRARLADWLAAQREAGVEPEIPPELENEANRKSYKDMTVEEFRGLVDTVKMIEHLGRLKHKLLTAADQRAYEAVRDEIAGSIEENAQGREAITRTPDTVLGKALKKMREFGAAHIKSATWARIMDGGKDGGPLWEYLVRPANERGDMETTMRAEATARLSEILDPVFKLGGMQKKKFFPSLNRSLTREARIAIALNSGNVGNLQRLLGGEGWTQYQIQPVLQSLTSAEWQAVQAIWDHFESYRPQIAEKERRIYGKEPDWVVPQPFTITTADGEALNLRGGYYPIKYDPVASQRAEEYSDAEGAKRQMQGAYTSATTRRSFTKSRMEEVSGRPLLYSLAGVYSGVNDVIHDLAWHEWLIDVNRLMRSNTIDRAIRSHYGPEVKQQFKKWIQDIAEGEKASNDAGDIAAAYLRQSVSVAGLGFNVVSAAMQPLGLTNSIARIGASWVGKGVARYIAGPISLTREVNGMSEFMQNRARTRFRELNELRNQVEGQTKLKEFVGHYAYFLMMRFQQAVDVPTWWGAYEKAIADGNDDARAIALADQAVIDAQGGGQLKDQAGIERTGPVGKLFTVFYSFMNTTLNLGVANGMTERQAAKRIANYLLLFVVPPMLTYALKAAVTPGDSGDDDPSKIAKKLLAAQIDYLMGMMVYVREFSDVFKTLAGANDMGREYQGPSGLRMVPDAFKLATQIHQGDFDDAFRKAAVNLMGDLFGLPSAQINRTITGAQALAEGETSNPAALAFGFQKPR